MAAPLLLTLAGCSEKSPGFVLVKNTCATDLDCAPDAGAAQDGAARCDPTSLQCVRDSVSEPYDVVLQVHLDRLPESQLVEQQTFAAFSLSGTRTDQDLELPAAVMVQGNVARHVTGGVEPLESEVTFVPVPKNPGAPVTSTVVATRGDGAQGDPPPNLQARLVPDTAYEVRVQPLLDPSSELPPVSFSYRTSNPQLDDILPTYDQTERRQGRLIDERGQPFAGQRVRLEDKQTGAVVSSTGRTDDTGRFELYALKDVMDGQGYNLVANLEAFPPWRVKIALDGTKLTSGAPAANASVLLPIIPTPVEYKGKVEATDPGGRVVPAPYADLVFVSHFPVPTEAVNLHDRDWCSWRLTSGAGGPPLCSARVATTADSDGSFSLLLLPGSYDVFISPGTSELSGVRALSTLQTTANVETQPNGAPHAGLTFSLPTAVLYKGVVLSPQGKPMPNITLAARSLALPGPTPSDLVYQYARSTTAVTDDSGRFELAVDVGYFDLSVQPPSETGFPWIQLLNREVTRSAEATILAPLAARAPVIVSGRVVHDGMPLKEAVVDAFALVKSIQGGPRAVHIGQATSGEDGSYRLVLPPEAGEANADD